MARVMLTPMGVIVRGAELADAQGFNSMTLSAIARSFGVQTPSLYGHVRDLSALRDGVTTLALGELSDLISEAIAGRSGRQALYAFGYAHRTYMHNHPGRWESLQHRVGGPVAQTPSASRIVRNTDAVLHGYDIPPTDRVHAIRIIGSSLSGFLNLERNGSFDYSEPSPELSWTELLESIHLTLFRWNERDLTHLEKLE